MRTNSISIPSDTQFLLLGFVCLMLCPLLSIPFIIYGIYHRQKGAYLLLSLLLGVFAFISAPSEDIYRHYCQYEYFSIRPITAIKMADVTLNGILPYLYWTMSHIGIPFSYLRFFELSVGFYLLSSIFSFMIEHSKHTYTQKEYFMRFALFFAFFDFLYTTMGVKFGFALCVFLYCLHLFVHKNKKAAGILFYLFACVWHFSFIFTGPILYSIYHFNPKKKTVLMGCFILAVLTPIAINLVGYYLFGRRFEFYFSKKADDVASYSAMTPIGLILYILPKLTVIPLAITLFKHYNQDSRWCRFALGWFVLAIILISNPVPFYRFWWAFMAISIFFILDIENLSTVFPQKTIKKLLICGILFTALNMLTYHKEVQYSQYYRSIYPVPLALDSDYSKRWVFSNIQYDGDFK